MTGMSCKTAKMSQRGTKEGKYLKEAKHKDCRENGGMQAEDRTAAATAAKVRFGSSMQNNGIRLSKRKQKIGSWQ